MKLQKFTALGLVAIVAAACGDDNGPGGGSSGDELTTQERDVIAAEVVSQVLGGGFGAFGGGALAPEAGPQLAPPTTISIDFSDIPDGTCETSGTILYSGSMSVTYDQQNPGDTSFDFDVIQDPNNCAFPAEELDLTVTVNGDPNLRMVGSFEIEDNQPVGEQRIDITGGFAWELSDGRSGACGVDIEFVYNSTSASYTGTVCGSSWNFTATGIEI